MILYNVTISLDPSVETDWLNWIRAEHLPEVMQTGLFVDCRLSQIQGQETGVTAYSILYYSKSEDAFETYAKEHAPRLNRIHAEKFNGKIASFSTIMNLIEEFKHVG